MRAVALQRITGNVGEIDTVPSAKSLQLHLYPQGRVVEGSALPPADIGRDGRFQFENLVPGDYLLVLQCTTQADKGDGPPASFIHVLAKQAISVGAADVNGIVLSVSPNANVTGQV